MADKSLTKTNIPVQVVTDISLAAALAEIVRELRAAGAVDPVRLAERFVKARDGMTETYPGHNNPRIIFNVLIEELTKNSSEEADSGDEE